MKHLKKTEREKEKKRERDKEMTNLKVTRSWMMTSGIQRNYYKETASFEVLDEKS